MVLEQNFSFLFLNMVVLVKRIKKVTVHWWFLHVNNPLTESVPENCRNFERFLSLNKKEMRQDLVWKIYFWTLRQHRAVHWDGKWVWNVFRAVSVFTAHFFQDLLRELPTSEMELQNTAKLLFHEFIKASVKMLKTSKEFQFVVADGPLLDFIHCLLFRVLPGSSYNSI